MSITSFNIRVYGIFVNNHNQLLLSDEKYGDQYFTKFPGGGLEYGEGTHECLVREMMEEHQLTIEVVSHFYTTDFFVANAFNTTSQIMSIYYIIKPLQTIDAIVSVEYGLKNTTLFQNQHLRFVNISDLSSNAVNFPIDKKVVSMLLELI